MTRTTHAMVKAGALSFSALLCCAGLGLALHGATMAQADETPAQKDAQEYSAAVQELFDNDAAKFETTPSNDNTFSSGTKYAADQPEAAQNADNVGNDPQSAPYTSEQYIADNTPKVEVREDGTQIQRVPNDIGYDAYKLVDFMPSFNLTYLDGQNRGCGACHDDLGELVSTMDDFDHQDITRCAPTDITVQMCIDCHTWQPGYITQQYAFGDLVHELHYGKNADTFDAMDGDCWSCHFSVSGNDEAGLPLFDEIKHNVYGGVTQVYDQSDVDAQVVWDQNRSSWTDTWDYNWRGPGFYWDHDRYHYQEENVPLSKDLFNEWTITVSGCVQQEVTFSLPELLEEVPIYEGTKAIICTMNPTGGPFFGNYDIKAIPLSWLVEKAGGYTTDAVSLQVMAADGSHEDLTRDVFAKHLDEIYIVYSIDGHLLNWEDGYPVWCWCPFMSAGNSWKSVSDFVFSDTSDPWLPNQNGWHEQSAEWTYDGNERCEANNFFNKPQVGVLNVEEGTVIETGKPYTVEGWSAGYDWTVAGVQVSLDGGASWTTYEFPDVDQTRIVNWYYTFMPQEDTSYVLRFRTIADNGRVTEEPVELMLVSHSADQIAADAEAAGAPLPTPPAYDLSNSVVAETGEVSYLSAEEANAEAIAAHPEWTEIESGVNDPATSPDDLYSVEWLAAHSENDAEAQAAEEAQEAEKQPAAEEIPAPATDENKGEK